MKATRARTPSTVSNADNSNSVYGCSDEILGISQGGCQGFKARDSRLERSTFAPIPGLKSPLVVWACFSETQF